jgi:hypothetical protein
VTRGNRSRDDISRGATRPGRSLQMSDVPGSGWKAQIDTDYPGWAGYRDLLSALDGTAFPETADLNRLLPPGLATASGKLLRFVPAQHIPGVEYEQQIFRMGKVSTREKNWHDLFNALVWCRWPRLKCALNAQHARHREEGGSGRRGEVRDALTLFDECGALVISTDTNLLHAMAQHRWQEVFAATQALYIRVTGHALMEKFLQPYKAMTAHVLLLEADPESADCPDQSLLRRLDRQLASALLDGQLLRSPADLSPLPLSGLQGWWAEPQDRSFYADRQVFRPLSAAREPAPVFRL